MNQFSVIIPTYNNPLELKDCLDSLAKQTFNDFEVIVINDGSNTDYSNVINYNYNFKINYIEITNSGGPARPRNIGITKSLGKYICFLDSDDLWAPIFLESILKYCDSFDFLCTGAFLKKNGKEFKIIPTIKSNFPDSILLKGNPIFTSSVVIRKELFSLNNFTFNESIELSSVEDLELWYRILKKGSARFKLIKEPLIYYKIESDSLSHKNYKSYIQKHKLLFKIFEEYIKLDKIQYYNYLKYLISIILYKNGKFIDSIRQILQINLLSQNGLFLTLKYILRILLIKRY
jgi:glycosyltransferase involved in cell wall biosynthesis